MRFSTKTFFAFSLSLATLAASLPISRVQAETDNPVRTEVSSEEAATLDQVDAYVEAWQLEDAIALLEGVVAEGTQVPGVYQKLGDLYIQAGLSQRDAAYSYKQAMDLALAAENHEAAADAQVALAEIAVDHANPNYSLSRQYLELAQANYEVAGKFEKAAGVSETIVALNEGSQTTNNTIPRPVFRSGSDNQNDALINPVYGCCFPPPGMP